MCSNNTSQKISDYKSHSQTIIGIYLLLKVKEIILITHRKAHRTTRKGQISKSSFMCPVYVSNSSPLGSREFTSPHLRGSFITSTLPCNAFYIHHTPSMLTSLLVDRVICVFCAEEALNDVIPFECAQSLKRKTWIYSNTRNTVMVPIVSQ